MIGLAARFRRVLASVAVVFLGIAGEVRAGQDDGRRLYVATPGVRDYLEYGGHGLLVFDIDHGHRLVRRIATAGLKKDGKPDNVKGVCASAATARIYVGTIGTLTCLDLVTEKILWEKSYEGDCDRMAITPQGQTIYLPSFEKDHWNVVDAIDGSVVARVVPRSGSHNTVISLDGAQAYLAGLRSPMLTVASTATHKELPPVGPFSAPIRPFTINGRLSHCFVNVNGLLGFEVGNLNSREMLHRVEVQGYQAGPVKRHGCPSHGIGLTPDEKELWVVDGHNKQVHIFDATTMPPKQVQSLPLRDEPGWITFSIDGRFAYPSTGEVIEVATRRTVATLADEKGALVMSEKMMEVDFQGGRPVRNGDQFGVGRMIPLTADR